VTAPQRFFFVHLLKTAGTTLFHRLDRHFGSAGVYPNDDDGDPVLVGPQIDPALLVERWPLRRDDVRIVAGHFPLCTVELLGDDFITLTVLREPVDRTLSYLRHHRQRTPEDAERSLEEVYEQQPRFDWLIHNHMVKMLGLRVEDMTGGMLTEHDPTRMDLDRAVERLEHDIDLFGLTEEFETFWAELADRYAIRLGSLVRTNETRAHDASDAFRRRIARDNELDVELYQYAVELFRRQRA
jgi:hypothetical protein